MFLEKLSLLRARRKASRAVKMVKKWLDQYKSKFPISAYEDLKRKVEELEALKVAGSPQKIRKSASLLIESAEKYLPFYKRGIIREWVEPLFSALVIALFLKAFVIQAFKIPSGSMYPTLLIGDHVLVNRLGYGFMIPYTDIKFLPFLKIKRGDIIVFKWPQNPKLDFIKRVIGLPGDKIMIRGQLVYVNDKPLPLESSGFLPSGAREFEKCGWPPNCKVKKYKESIDSKTHFTAYVDCNIVRDFGPIRVPEEHYFVMGDNRDCSNDSRYWGFVPFKNIKGKALILYWSWGPKQLSRIGKIVR